MKESWVSSEECYTGDIEVLNKFSMSVFALIGLLRCAAFS